MGNISKYAIFSKSIQLWHIILKSIQLWHIILKSIQRWHIFHIKHKKNLAFFVVSTLLAYCKSKYGSRNIHKSLEKYRYPFIIVFTVAQICVLSTYNLYYILYKIWSNTYRVSHNRFDIKKIIICLCLRDTPLRIYKWCISCFHKN